uniref:Large ribosomal subunit protein uL4m n=1 Tax=Oncorhynchus kisutch TaxID=8019 RepID=A0A8C7DKQ3_ONCKI
MVHINANHQMSFFMLPLSFFGENALPLNVCIPYKFVDPARSKRPPPPSDSSLPVLGTCDAVVPVHLSPVQTWVETLERRDSKRLGLVDLHPMSLQSLPAHVTDMTVWRCRGERSAACNILQHDRFGGGSVMVWGGISLGGRTALPCARGVSHGPRGPTSFDYMFPMKLRVQGLKIALSSKLAQDYLHVVDTLNIPTPDPQYLMDLIRYRHWGESVLIVDLPENILQATESLKTVNVIPGIGLNVHSMLKHEVLVLTLEAVKFLENKLLWHDERFTPLYPFKHPYTDLP